MSQALAFIGYHNSGKTTLIRKVYRELSRRGYTIAILKSTKHHLRPFEKAGSDTDLYISEGIDRMAVVTPSLITAIRPNSGQGVGALAASLFPEVDLVLCEGFKSADDIKKVEVARSAISTSLIRDNVKGVIAVVSDFEIRGLRRFGFDETGGLCDFIEEALQLSSTKAEDDIQLIVDGKRIPMKRFVRESMKGTICGYVGSLRFTENARNIEIFIKIRK